jgi:hypothetical protein
LYDWSCTLGNSQAYLPRREYQKLRALLDDKLNILPADASRRFKGRITPSPLLKAFCFTAHAPTRPSFFTKTPLWLHHSVSLSQAVSTAFESLEAPLKGVFFTYGKDKRYICRTGSSVRGVLVSHYLQMFNELSISTSGSDVQMIKCIKASFYRFLVRAVHRYQIEALMPPVGKWPNTRTFSIVPRASWRMIQREMLDRDPDGPSKIVQLAYCISIEGYL